MYHPCKIIMIMICIAMQACSTSRKELTDEVLALPENQMTIRQVQTRTYDIADQKLAIRGLINALQDMGFIIERTNNTLGLITAGKLHPNHSGLVELTVSIRAANSGQTKIRVNALHNTQVIKDPEEYQRFFTIVERSLFMSEQDMGECCTGKLSEDDVSESNDIFTLP